MTNVMKLTTGAVLKVYTPDGKSIKDFDGLEDGGRYICCGAEKFDKENSKQNILNGNENLMNLITVPVAIFKQEEEEKPLEISTPEKQVEKKPGNNIKINIFI